MRLVASLRLLNGSSRQISPWAAERSRVLSAAIFIAGFASSDIRKFSAHGKVASPAPGRSTKIVVKAWNKSVPASTACGPIFDDILEAFSGR